MSISNQFQIEQDRQSEFEAMRFDEQQQVLFERTTLDICNGAEEILQLDAHNDLTVGPVELFVLEIAMAKIGKFLAAHKQKAAA